MEDAQFEARRQRLDRDRMASSRGPGQKEKRTELSRAENA